MSDNLDPCLSAVLAAGTTLRLWSVLPATLIPEHMRGRMRYVETPDPESTSEATLRFELCHSSNGAYKPAQIVAEVAPAGNMMRGVCVHPRDVRGHEAEHVTASCSVSRTPETIAKDLHRRAMATPEAQRQAREVERVYAERVSQREALLSHVKRLTVLGYRIAPSRGLSEETYWSATLYGPNAAPSIEVTASGQIRVERCSVEIDAFAHFLKLVRS